MEPSQPQGPPRRISPYPSGQPRVTLQLPGLSFPRWHSPPFISSIREVHPLHSTGSVETVNILPRSALRNLFSTSLCRPNGECTAAPLPQHWHGTSLLTPTSLYPQGTAQYWQGTARYRHRPTHPTELYLYCTTGKRDAPRTN